MPSHDQAVDARYVEKICVINQGGFVMSFKVGERSANSTTELNDSCDNYPIGQSRTVDLTSLERQPEVGAEISPIISAFWGKTVGGPSVLYAPNGQTATYLVTGTTLNIDVKLT